MCSLKIIILDIQYVCSEKITLSIRQWQLISAVVFGIYATGMELPDRPEHELTEKTLLVKFESLDQFRAFTRRAFAIRASRMIAFGVTEITENKITCGALFNETESVGIAESVLDEMFSSTD